MISKKKKKIQEATLHAIPDFLAGSFAVLIGDHLRSNLGIIFVLGIICGPVHYCYSNLGAIYTKGPLPQYNGFPSVNSHSKKARLRTTNSNRHKSPCLLSLPVKITSLLFGF